MFKLSDRLPDGIKVDGKFYKCDFDFRNVLKLIDVMQREDICPDARDYLCLKCVMRRPPKDAGKAYKAVLEMLFETNAVASGERLTSFEQDAPLIRSAFRQVYQIDLFRDPLTWFEFKELLHGLPDGNRYEEVIGIRAREMPAPTKYNAKEREWLLWAKQSVALHLTDAEQAKKYDKDVGNIFAGLLSITKDVK